MEISHQSKRIRTRHDMVAIWLNVLDTWLENPEHFSPSLLRAELLRQESHLPSDGSDQEDTTCIRYCQRLLVPRFHRETHSMVQVVHVYQYVDEGDFCFDVQCQIERHDEQQPWPFFYPRLLRYNCHCRLAPLPRQEADGIDCAQSDGCDHRLWQVDLTVTAEPEDVVHGQANTSREAMERCLNHWLDCLLRFMAGNARANDGMYVKRRLHDRLVERNFFQDTYHRLKTKYKVWADRWTKGFYEAELGDEGCCSLSAVERKKHGAMSTDPQKHVFEDVAIASFLICYWQTHSANKQIRFVDVGCGNGLLVHILTEEGYIGYGLDVDDRSIWNIFNRVPEAKYTTQLRQQTLDCSSACFDVHTGQVVEDWQQYQDFASASSMKEYVERQSEELWLIGNHSDELTPWMPILATRTNLRFAKQQKLNSKIFSLNTVDDGDTMPCKCFILPCCYFDLDGRKFSSAIPLENDYSPTNDSPWPPQCTQEGDGRYGQYVRWVEQLCRSVCEMQVKSEWLRIPSTKNVALLGQQQTQDFIGNAERIEERMKLLMLSVAFVARLSHAQRRNNYHERKLRPERSEQQDAVEVAELHDAFGNFSIDFD